MVLWRAAAGIAIAAPTLQPPAAVPPTVDAETQTQIRKLKLQAQDALDAGEKTKARELYRQVLRLDPDDALAGKKNDELTRELTQKTTEDKNAIVDREDQRAKEARANAAIERAEDAIIEAKQTGAGEPLARARAAIEEAKKYVRAGDPRIEQLQGRIDQLASERRIRFWELWAVVGLVAVGLVVALVLYVMRGKRMLEMIEGAQMGQVFVLQKEATALGALASDVDWAIEDPLRKISRHHCNVLRQGRRYFLVDTSMNGTFLNGRPLQKGQPALLKRGDEIGLGGAVTLRFR